MLMWAFLEFDTIQLSLLIDREICQMDKISVHVPEKDKTIVLIKLGTV